MTKTEEWVQIDIKGRPCHYEFMFKKEYCIYLFWAWLLFPQSAIAKVRVAIEPYLGYSQYKWKSGGVSDTNYGAILGGKGGLSLNKEFTIALDYHLGGPYELEDQTDNEFLNRMWGAGLLFVGKNTRLWFGYYYINELEDINRNIVYQGNAFKLSFGFEFRSKLSINLELISQEFDDTRSNLFFGTPINIKTQVLFVSISAPLFIK